MKLANSNQTKEKAPTWPTFPADGKMTSHSLIADIVDWFKSVDGVESFDFVLIAPNDSTQFRKIIMQVPGMSMCPFMQQVLSAMKAANNSQKPVYLAQVKAIYNKESEGELILVKKWIESHPNTLYLYN